MHVRATTLVVGLLASGCLTPRSMTLGELAAPVGRGATEVSVFGGVPYTSQADPPITSTNSAQETVTNQQTSRGFALPGAEANVQHGFNDRFALNLHASPAGVQPGLKWTLNHSRVAHVALLPAVGLGYASYATSTLSAGGDGVQQEVSPSYTTSFTFLAGLKVLVSHRSGVYGGIGYDFVFNRSLNAGILGSGNVTDHYQNLTVRVMHQVMAAVGFDVAMGQVHLRPEIAFSVVPQGNATWTARTGPTETTTTAGGGFAFTVMPGVSLAVASPPREPTEEELDEERPAKQRRGGDQEEGDDEEQEHDED